MSFIISMTILTFFCSVLLGCSEKLMSQKYVNYQYSQSLQSFQCLCNKYMWDHIHIWKYLGCGTATLVATLHLLFFPQINNCYRKLIK